MNPQSSSGTLVIESNALLTAGNFFIGDQNTYTDQVFQAGGDAYVTGQVRLGHWPSNVSNYLLGGGTLTLTLYPRRSRQSCRHGGNQRRALLGR